MFEFLAGLISGAALVGLVLIILGPSRRIRSEAGIDGEIEVRILLGLEPEPVETMSSQQIVTPLPAYDDGQIKQLQDLSRAPKKRKTH